MKVWNYRVVQIKSLLPRPLRIEGGRTHATHFEIYEIYYDKHGNIVGRSTEPIRPLGASHKDLIGDLECMISATHKSVLTLDEIDMEIADNA